MREVDAEPSLWSRFRPRWNVRDGLTFWLPIGIVSVAAICAAYWTEISTATATRVEAIREAVVSHPDFSVRRVEIEGRKQTPRDFVMDAGSRMQRSPLIRRAPCACALASANPLRSGGPAAPIG